MVNTNDKEGVLWFVCAFDCRVRLELFTIWVWEPLSSTHLIRPFLMAMKKLSLTTKHPWDSKRMVGLVVFKA